MYITFADSTNRDIQRLVALCSPTSLAASGVLLTPPLEELLQEPHFLESDIPLAEGERGIALSTTIKAHQFSASHRLMSDFIIAVDSGVMNLGQFTASGPACAFALRGAAVCSAGKDLFILRYNTGALLITPRNKVAVFSYISQRLGKPDLYVTPDVTGKLVTRPSAADTINQMQDRCRNFVERIIQEEALSLLAENRGGILLIDGALTVSYDTPRVYLQQMLTYAREKGIDVCAISKRSTITLGDTPIDAIFDPYPTFVGYAPLRDIFERERSAYEHLNMRPPEDITVGTELFAVRFGLGPPGITFRVDTSKCYGSTDRDIINDVYNKCQIYGGYPKLLIDAHQYSTFLGGEALNILADLVVRTGLRVKEQPSMGVLFEPFGTFGK
jgi:hypothetical protein